MLRHLANPIVGGTEGPTAARHRSVGARFPERVEFETSDALGLVLTLVRPERRVLLQNLPISICQTSTASPLIHRERISIASARPSQHQALIIDTSDSRVILLTRVSTITPYNGRDRGLWDAPAEGSFADVFQRAGQDSGWR